MIVKLLDEVYKCTSKKLYPLQKYPQIKEDGTKLSEIKR